MSTDDASVGGGQYCPAKLALLLNSLTAIATQLPALNEAVNTRWRPYGQLHDEEKQTPPIDPYFVDRLFQVNVVRCRVLTKKYLTP
jgi:xanthine/CO dehydrogenase XdhC/CoxF family maturation factor